jgi:hypothetical protein
MSIHPKRRPPAKNVNAEKLIRVAKSAVLGKVGREGSETLAIA